MTTPATSYNKHIDEISYKYSESDKFKTTRTLRTFIFEDLETCADPEQALWDCFDDLINRALAKANNPDHIGISISSLALEDDIILPIRPVAENTLAALIKEFSKPRHFQADMCFYEEPFTLIITTINKKELPRKPAQSYTYRRCL